jgi:tetratricopeptide (TPR) repeat protein
VLEYGKQALVPTGEAVRRSRWHALDDLMGWDGDGKIETVVGYVLDGLAKANQLAKFRDEIAAELPKYPQWQAGPLLVAIMDVRLGKEPDGLAKMIEPLLEPQERDYQRLYAQWTVAQELEAKPAYHPLAIKLLERATTSDDAFMNGFDLSPARRLVHLYKNDGQREEARKLLVREAVRDPRDDGNYTYRLGRHLESMLGIGRLLSEIDFPVDAFRVYRELLVNPKYSDPTISQYIGRSPEQFQGQARQAMQGILKKLEKSPSGEMATAFLIPSQAPRPGEAVLDLMISATPAAGSALPSLESPLAMLIRPTAFRPEATSRVEEQLVRLATEHPRDFSVAIAAALFALRGDDETQSTAVLARLEELVRKNPLEGVPVGKRPNSRQRAEAQQQIGLWLVARECLRMAPRRELAEQLAERAVAAAQRQLEPEQLTAILYERGKMALDARDAALAQKTWNELIELALVQPRLPKAGAPNAASGAAGNASPGVPRPANAAPPSEPPFTGNPELKARLDAHQEWIASGGRRGARRAGRGQGARAGPAVEDRLRRPQLQGSRGGGRQGAAA